MVPAASDVILRLAEAVFLRLKALSIPEFSSFLDIQPYCFLAGIYVCVHFFGCQKKSTSFQKLKSSNVFYVRARQMMPVAKRPAASAGANREAPCFGHTGVTFDVEIDRPGPGSLRGHFDAGRGRFV